jgi:hypothetical protein
MALWKMNKQKGMIPVNYFLRAQSEMLSAIIAGTISSLGSKSEA